MDSTILAALIGVPTTLVTAAIAYPVGRGVARRQAEDQHTQWLRTQRQSASSQLADGATEFIESADAAWEAVARPAYAHIRRRDIESRKRLDPALYEPLRAALRLMHDALPAVAIHGPDELTVAGQELCSAAVEVTGAILHLDAAAVQSSVIGAALQASSVDQQGMQAALDDLDTAYARLAAPLGLPEFSARAETTLRWSAVATDVARLAVSLDDPPAASAALDDLRRAVAGDPELTALVEPYFAVMALAELRSMVRAVEEGQQIGLDQQLAAIASAAPVMTGIFTTFRDTLQNPLPADVDRRDLPPGLSPLLESLAAVTDHLHGALRLMHDIQQHLALADELAATPLDPVTGFFAGAVWASQMEALGLRVMEELPRLTALAPQMANVTEPFLAYSSERANTEVGAVRDSFIQARIDFVYAARKAISS